MNNQTGGNDRAAFLQAMGRAVNGVSIVTTDGPRGRFGLTVSSVASVSAEPPMVLVCVNRGSPAHAAMIGNGVFSVNLLNTHQRELADAFAGRPGRTDAYEFADPLWQRGSRTGAPLLLEAVAAFECTLVQVHHAGSHSILVGGVELSLVRAGNPLSVHAPRVRLSGPPTQDGA